MNKLKKLNQAGIAHILLIIILIIGIIAGVYLVGKTQIFKPKASSEMVEWIPSQSDSDNCVNSQSTTTCSKVKFKIFGPGDTDRSNTTSPDTGSSDVNGEP